MQILTYLVPLLTGLGKQSVRSRLRRVFLMTAGYQAHCGRLRGGWGRYGVDHNLTELLARWNQGAGR